jgi:DNA polymerase I-like protein with 3'-5' exonuclease and polymerase domains
MTLPNLPDLSRHESIRADFETTGLKWYEDDEPIGVALQLPATGESYYVPFKHRVGPNYDPAIVREWMRREFRGKHITNAKIGFDIHMSRKAGADWTELDCTFADVLHNAAILDDNRYTFNLDDIAQATLGESFQKLKTVNGVALDKTRMAYYPADVVGPYAIQDVTLVDALDRAQMVKLAEEDLLRVWQLENDVIPAVVEMEKNGAPLDLDLLARYERETRKELEDVIYRIWKNTGIKFDGAEPTLLGIQKADPKFPLDTCRRLFRSRGIPIPQKTVRDKDGVRVVESFEDDLLAGITDESIQLFRYGKQIASLRSKFIVPFGKIAGRDGILRYGLHQLASDEGGTVSGRFSSSGKDARKQQWGVNIQQIFSIDNQLDSMVGRWLVRRLIVPAAGQWFSADAKQVEYRLFAHYANSPKINAVYARDPDADFHVTVMDLLNTLIEINRKHTKNVNFAMVFGAGQGKFADMCGLVAGYTDDGHPIPNQHAQDLYGAYTKMFPEVKPLLRKASDLAMPPEMCETRCKYQPCHKVHRGFVKTALGRRARFPHGRKLHSALNRIIQGTAASLNKRKIVQLYRERKRLELTMRFTVHDENNGDLLNPHKRAAIVELLNAQDSIDGKGKFSRIPLLWDDKVSATWATDYAAKAQKRHEQGKITSDALAEILK